MPDTEHAPEAINRRAVLAAAALGAVPLRPDSAQWSAGRAGGPAKLGAVYLQSDIHRLVRAIGVGQSHRMIFLAEAVDAGEAARIGLIEKVLPSGEFDTHLDEMVDAIAKGSPFTLSQTKEMVRSIALAHTPPETDASLAKFVAATQGDDFGEGVQAFLEKRSPVFGSRGR